MLNFVKNLYSTLVEIVLWIILVVFTVVGYKLGDGVLDNSIIGALVGLLSGVVVDVLLGGFVATIIAIERNTSISGGYSVDEDTVPLMPNHNVAAKPTFDVQGRTNVSSWWDSDGVKHESWVDADGTRHET